MNEEEKKEAIINFAELKRRMKWQTLKNKAKEAGTKALEVGCKAIGYAEEHKEGILIVSGALAGGTKIVKTIAKHHDNKKQERNFYDHSTQSYLRLKRPLKQKEKLEAFERNQRGEKYVDIYRSMGVL